MAGEQQHHCADGHGEVERAVEDVPEDDEPVPRKEGVVDPLFDIEPHRLLDVDDAFGVAERRARTESPSAEPNWFRIAEYTT